MNIILNILLLANNHDYIRTYTYNKSVMSSYRQILYHVILRTKDSKKTLTQTHIKELYAYILGIIKNKNCMLYRIICIEDHIHILSGLHPGYALADYVKEIKVASSLWIKKSEKFPSFIGWSDG